ncbi:hypothetical protein AB0K35_04210 [Micromonospora sp. NPDC053740]|uniref:hypothetical protein n=1 Tax=Micromonospora sp. NPDC053740 TaxID=3155173 RepID=UPI0034276873
MRTTPAVDEQMVAELARIMLQRAASVRPAQVAAERRVFDLLRDAYIADPKRALAGGDPRSGQLKLGLPEVEYLLTPVLLDASAQVLSYVVSLGVVTAAVSWTRSVRRLLGLTPVTHQDADGADHGEPVADGPGVGMPVLTSHQWAEVRALVARSLIQHGRMPTQEADLLAAAIVGDWISQPRTEPPQ